MKITTSDARFRAGLDPVVIRASSNLGRVVDLSSCHCESRIGCQGTVTALLWHHDGHFAFAACDVCAASMLRSERIVVLVQLPPDKDGTS